MTGTIEIRNLRHIKKMKFHLPTVGVWLLTGGNGTGKTSLLACILRIGNSMAFAHHFPSSLQSERLDNYSKGTIDYSVKGNTVSYAYRGARWTPRPRSNSHILEDFDYPSITYIGATADRITPRPEDFDPSMVRSCSRFIIEAANSIFSTQKFSMLRTINLSRGKNNEAFVLAIQGNPLSYHSEKHFSLGELCVLKLLKVLKEVSDNSMIIIDELEMALHPKAQVNLLKFIKKQAEEKSLTVIFSSHSVTLLKSVNKNNIIYLDKNDDGEIVPIVGCYPTYAIGNLASEEETLPDLMIYVEDVFARDLTQAFFLKYTNAKHEQPMHRPTTKVVPVGGYKEVVAFYERNKSVLPVHCKQHILLDNDVLLETVEQWKNKNNHVQLAKFDKSKNNLAYLPFTPELGIIKYINNNISKFEASLRSQYGDNQLQLGNLVNPVDTTKSGAEQRKEAKKIIEDIIRYLEDKTQSNDDMVRLSLCNIFAELSWPAHKNAFNGIFGKMLNA